MKLKDKYTNKDKDKDKTLISNEAYAILDVLQEIKDLLTSISKNGRRRNFMQ